MVLLQIIRTIRLFSLDIVAGALAALVYSASVMGIELPRSYYLIMALTVWMIYAADHLMDGAKTRGKSDSGTHNFFYTYKIPVILVFLIVLIFDFRLILYRLDHKIIEFGMAPGMAAVAYLILNRYYGDAPKWYFIKEPWIALIYTIAIWGGPIIIAGDRVNPAQIIIIISFFLLIMSNVLIYSIYEREEDARQGNKSFVKDFGLRAAVNMVVFSLVLSLAGVLSAYLFLGAKLYLTLPILIIAAGMLQITSFPMVFEKEKLYGIMADLLLLIFLLVLVY